MSTGVIGYADESRTTAELAKLCLHIVDRKSIDDFAIYHRQEVFLDMIVHSAGLLFVAVAGPKLIAAAAQAADPVVYFAVVGYVFSFISMLTASMLYNAVLSSATKRLLLRFDQSAILAKILGTYAPLALIAVDGAIGAALLGLVAIAVAGGIANAMLCPKQYRQLQIPICLSISSAAIFLVVPLYQALSPTAFALVWIGALAYSGGIKLLLARHRLFHNASWHLFVLAGALCHFTAISELIAA
jgi:hemolysin III